VARALRRPSTDETLDGTLARAILTALVGHQRQAMAVVDGVEARAVSDDDRAWVRALRLRITGDWRAKPSAGAPLLVRFEYARAVRERLGIDAYMEYVEPVADAEHVDWARMAFFDGLSIEAGRHFTEKQIQAEWGETALLWIRMNGRQRAPEPIELVQAIDARPAAAPVERSGQWVKVRVLDWGMWASHQQRHLAHAVIARAYFARQLASDDIYDELLEEVETQYAVTLRLFPIVLRWMAESEDEYQQALELARPLVRDAPEIVNQRVWTMLLEKPRYASRAAPFPLDQAWFTPAVPAGTAFELSARALRPGCPRPPTREQAADWAREMPYDHWTVWGGQWLGVDGKPSLEAVRKAFGPLIEYDSEAVEKLLDYMDMSPADRIEVARSLCLLVTGRCDRLAELLLLAGRTPEAAQAYDKWADGARDRVGVANGITWLFRYHLSQGATKRAEALASMAGDVESRRGLDLHSEWHERQGRYAEAGRLLRRIEERYDNSAPLGTFLMRGALASNDAGMKTKAAELLRNEYPLGPQPLVMHALPATPGDGVRFATFGPRLETLGFERGDIIVGVDGWRVHNNTQYLVAVRFSYDETMTFTVFRHGRYQELRVRVPERWLGARMDNLRR
jgi:tetratricopeptide (TPR) repeat protein